MQFASVLIAVAAVFFAVASFWWLNARSGRLRASAPGPYAFVDSSASNGARLRFPLSVFNPGATTQALTDLRLRFVDEPEGKAVPWQTTRRTLRPETDDVVDYPVAFPVPPRSVTTIVVEFGDADFDFLPEPRSRHAIAIDGLAQPTEKWIELVAFDWNAPPDRAVMSSYIAHHN